MCFVVHEGDTCVLLFMREIHAFVVHEGDTCVLLFMREIHVFCCS